jgi:DnaJ-class molecular chaperone
MKRPWREVLEFGNGPANEHEITRNYRILAKEFHPDRQGGDSGKMTELNAARVEALKEIAA